MVTREGEGLAGSGGVEKDVAENDREQDNRRETVRSRGGGCGLEDVEEWKAGGIVEGIFYGRHGEEIGDDQYDCHESVAKVAPGNGDWYVSSCVFHFF